MRSATAALLVLIAALVACLLVAARSDPVTSPPAPSRSGDAPRRVRAIDPDPADVEEESDEEDANDEEEAAKPDVTEEPAPPRRVIRIVDGHGDPVPGIAVEAGGEFTRSTDAAGESSFQALGESSHVKFFDGVVRREVVLVEPFTEVVATLLPSLEVSAVDARTGIALDPVRFRLHRGGDEAVFWTGRDLPTLAVAQDGDATFAVSIDAPAGYGGYETITWRGKLATRTRTVRFVVPVFDTTERTVVARFYDGRPARGAVVSRIWAWDVHPVLGPARAACFTHADSPSGADGLIRIANIPRIPFTRLNIDVTWEGELGGKSAKLETTIVGMNPLAASPAEPLVARFSNGGWYRGPGGFMSGCGAPSDRPGGPTAPLSVRVVHRDGTPARRVDVDAGEDSATTDSDGCVSFAALPVGPRSIVAAAHGFTATVVCVEVGSTECVEIREAAPRLVRVTVKDVDGMPVPSACVGAACRNVIDKRGERRSVTWSAASAAQLVDGVEEIAPRTDRLGVALLRVPRGAVEYTAALGKAETEVTSDADDVEIVLEEPSVDSDDE